MSNVASIGCINPPVMGSSCLLVSQDAALSQQVRRLLAEDYGCEARVVREPNFSQVTEETTLLLDIRTVSSAAICEQQAKLNSRPVLTISMSDDEAGPRWQNLWARHLHLRLPINSAKLSQILRHDVAAALAGSSKDERFTVQFKDYSYGTYSKEFHQTLVNLRRVAQHEVTILLVGETGTGKTTLARLIHELSPRSKRPLLTVACGALPGELLESELFGYSQGAFTGADRQRIGKFEAAGDGTVLLDEIDVLGLQQQAKLLRVIETGEFEPVGSNETQTSQARLIVATNIDLNELMARNEFRSDLYYRLNVLEFHIPPLRQRPQDIYPLTLEFIDEFCRAHNVRVSRIHPEFLERIGQHDWLGNVRELKNHMRRSVLFCQNQELTPRDLAPAVQQAQLNDQAARSPQADSLSERVALNEQEILREALEANNFKRTATAESLGISRVGLYKKMRKYGMLDVKVAPKSERPT
ncbi:MAG: sigma-54 dependent transcriptional regulator [Planctomycetota bacterium]|nr:sigma-54 dependent transcriptional regulator [Planctomycetota bacterium]